jgi:hypothetical protein
MAKKNVLQIVQAVLDSIDGDPVNSITDTEEAYQVARLCQGVFEELVARRKLPLHKTLDQLESVGDSNKPNYLKLPAATNEVLWLKYDKKVNVGDRDLYQVVEYLHPDQFIYEVNKNTSTTTNVTTVADDSGVALLIRNDIAPRYYTSFDDEFLVFDSYDSDIDTTLVAAKTQLYARNEPVFTLDDLHIPAIPTDYFPLLIAECTSTCALRINQEADQKAEQVSLRQQRHQSRNSFRVKGGIRYANLGRRGVRPKDPTFELNRRRG